VARFDEQPQTTAGAGADGNDPRSISQDPVNQGPEQPAEPTIMLEAFRDRCWKALEEGEDA
jgi:hypothetical protein